MRKAFSKKKWAYLLFTVGNPMEGYYWIRRQEKGSVPIAILLVIVFGICFTSNRLLASFVVNDIDPRGVNLAFELLGVLIFYLLLCVSNWSITSLMNGEGRLKDIAIAIGYGTLPISFGLVLATIVSQFLADDEQAFYSIILIVTIAYGVIMCMMGIMQVHNYTLGKTIITLFLTFVAMLIIVFIVMLMFNLLGRVVNFFQSIYTEIVFRT